ncbi:MAG: ABC transporter ATP-binding protein [Planctomycetota bacterium]
MAETNDKNLVISVQGLKTCFFTEAGIVKAVDGVSFNIPYGETLGLVGESGCGKSVAALSILRLVPAPAGKITEGKIIFEGKDLLLLPEQEMRKIRGRKISMVFQEPMTSLNPVFTVGEQVMEAIRKHKKVSNKEARERTIELFRKVEIPDPAIRIDEYPHQLSGGQKQRVMIAMALSLSPSLIIADEPTTALDVTTEAQILDLLTSLQKEYNMSMLLITHDLGVVAQAAQNVAVMYAGKIVEYAPVEILFDSPLHPYTRALLKSIPTITKNREKLKVIPGEVPIPLRFPEGCRFHPRCDVKDKRCETDAPEMLSCNNRMVRCWKVEN